MDMNCHAKGCKNKIPQSMFRIHCDECKKKRRAPGYWDRVRREAEGK